jgi:uncharacterized oligopeptide transporter (OPT) family protein
VSEGGARPLARTPQLTLRAALAGMALGGVLCLSNLYVVLRTGWSLGVTITSTVLAFALFRGLRAVGLVRTDFSVLENNLVATTASAAAWMTGGGNMAALPALLVLTGERPGGWAMVAWFAVIAALGVFLAIPLKRQLVEREQLPFPQSVATAETLRAMHGAGAVEGAPRALLSASVVAGLFTALRELGGTWLPVRLASRVGLPFSIAGRPALAWTLGLEPSLVLVGGGSMMRSRTAWSLVLGAAATWGVLAPALASSGAVASVDYRALVQFTLWPGAGLLVSSGLLSIGLQSGSLVRAARDLVAGASAEPRGPEEAPTWWFPAGYAVLSPVMVVLMHALFGIPWWAAAMAIPLSLVVGVVAARVTGETDVTPTKAMGPATQLLYGVALPGHLAANVMSANVTAGVGLHAADLLGDLKTGSLLGASPRRQVVAQLVGVVVGAAVVVPAFTLLVPTAEALGTEQLPAPAAMVWAGVSRVLAAGLDGLQPAARLALALGAAAGVLLVALERALPARARAWVPSPAALGISMVMPASNSLTMALGTLLAALVRRRWPGWSAARLVPAASGLIAGESLVGVAVALGRAGGLVP